MSTAMQWSWRTPMAFIRSSEAMPAAPAPHSTTFTSSSRRPVIAQALIRPADEMIAVKHRNVEQFLKLGLDAEALGALDILQIDAPKGDADVLDHGDDLVGVAGGNLDIDAVHVGEALEEHALALHHRLGRQGAQIAQTQDRGAVGNHRHQVALGGVFVGKIRVAGDSQDRRMGLVATTPILPGVG